jgi:dTMP kinase
MVEINRFAIGDAVPDLTLLVDIPVEVGFRRLAGRHAGGGGGPDRLEREERAFHERVRAGYLDLARREPGRFRVVDGDRDEAAVAAEIWGHVEHVLGHAHR